MHTTNPALVIGCRLITLGLVLSPLFVGKAALAQDDAWVRNCNRQNNLAYCQEQAKKLGGSTGVTSSAQMGASFSKGMSEAMGAWDSFGKGTSGKSLAELATPDAMAKFQAEHVAREAARKELATPEGKRKYYSERKGKGNAEMDFLYAVYTQDIPEKMLWIKKAADGGHPDALYTMAFYHSQGVSGIKKDSALFFSYAQKAAKAGQMTAQGLYGHQLAYGQSALGIKADPKEGFRLVDEACSKNSYYGCLVLANFYADGTGTAKDLAKAVALYEKVEAKNSSSAGPLSYEKEAAHASFRLAELYSEGEDVPMNKAKARQHLLKSVNAPGGRLIEPWIAYADALIAPESVYEFPETNVARGLEILTWFADRDISKGMDILGNLYLTGKFGVKKDVPLALSLLEKSANLNDTESMMRLAIHHVDLGPEGEKTAFKWIQKAALARHPIANWRLAQHYYQGMGVEQSIPKYQEAISVACDLYVVDACVEIGSNQLKGEAGFAKDLAAARKALGRADKYQHARAALLLSLSYLGPNGVMTSEADVVAGVRHAFDAKKRGSPNADSLLTNIAKSDMPEMRKAYNDIKAAQK